MRQDDIVTLVDTISQRIARYLEKVGLVGRDIENSYLNLPLGYEDSFLQLQGASVSYRFYCYAREKTRKRRWPVDLMAW